MNPKEMRFSLMIESLEENKTTEAKEHLNHLRKMEENNGFIRASEGMISSIEDRNEDSLIYQIFNDKLDMDKIEKLELKFKKWRKEPFRDQYEDNYHKAWNLLLDIIKEDLE